MSVSQLFKNISLWNNEALFGTSVLQIFVTQQHIHKKQLLSVTNTSQGLTVIISSCTAYCNYMLAAIWHKHCCVSAGGPPPSSLYLCCFPWSADPVGTQTNMCGHWLATLIDRLSGELRAGAAPPPFQFLHPLIRVTHAHLPNGGKGGAGRCLSWLDSGVCVCRLTHIFQHQQGSSYAVIWQSTVPHMLVGCKFKIYKENLTSQMRRRH